MARQKDVFGVTITGDISGLKKVMNDAVSVFKNTERSLKNVNDALKLDPTNIDLLKKKQDLLKKAVADGEDALRRLKKAQDDILNDPNYKEGNTDLRVQFTELEKQIAQVTDKTKNYRAELNKLASARLEQLGAQLTKIGETFAEISRRTQMLSAAFAGILAASFESAKSYETQIAGIKRVISDLSDETIKELKNIAVETGTAFEDIAEVATFGGALGLVEDELSSFVKTMTDLNTATGGAFGGEEGAKAVVVFLNQLGLGIEALDNFGSAIAVVGDKYADIGDETLTLATALSSLSTIAKVDQYDLIGLAGVMADLGLTGETASSAITRTFAQITKAVDSGDKMLAGFAKAAGMSAKEFTEAWKSKPMETFNAFINGLGNAAFSDLDKAVKNNEATLKEYAEVLGVTGEQFKAMWGVDSQGTFQKYVDALGELDDVGESAITVLGGVKLTSVRAMQTLLRLAGRGGEVAEAISLANQAWNENTALTDKANGIYDTTERKLQGMYESLKQLGSALMDDVMPFIKTFIDNITRTLQIFGELDPKTKGLIVSFLAVGASISPLTKLLSVFLLDLPKLIAMLAGPAGLVLLVGGLAAAVGALAYNEAHTGSRGALNNIKKMKEAYEDLSKSLAESVAQKEYDLALIDQYVKTVQSTINDLGKGDYVFLDGGEANKQKIVDYINKINEAIGEVRYSYDEAKNAIVNSEGEVVSITEDWSKLSDEILRSFAIEKYSQQAQEAESMQRQLMQEQMDSLMAYKDTMEKLGGEYEEWVEKFKENPLSFGEEYGRQDSTTQENINKAIEAWMLYDQTVKNVAGNYEQYQNDIDNFNKLLTGTPEEAEKAIQAFEHGLNVDPAKNDIDELSTKIENLQYVLDNGEGFDGAFIDDVTDDLKYYKEQLDLALAAQGDLKSNDVDATGDFSKENIAEKKGNIADLYTGSGGLLPTNNSTFETITASNKTSWNAMIGSMLADFIAMLNNIGEYSASHPISIKSQMSTPSGMSSLGLGGFSSGGFSSGGFSSSGFASGGMNNTISINNTFTINNGSNLNEATLRRYGDIIGEQVNEYLGRLV